MTAIRITKVERRRRVAERWYQRTLSTEFMRTLRLGQQIREIFFHRTLDLHGTTLCCVCTVLKRSVDVPMLVIMEALAKRLGSKAWGNVDRFRGTIHGQTYDELYSSQNELKAVHYCLRIELSTRATPSMLPPGEYVDTLLDLEARYSQPLATSTQ